MLGAEATVFTIAGFIGVKVEGITVKQAIIVTAIVMGGTALVVLLWHGLAGIPQGFVGPQSPTPSDTIERDLSRWLDNREELADWMRKLLDGRLRLQVHNNRHPGDYLGLAEKCSSASYQLYAEATDRFRSGEIIDAPTHPRVREAIANAIDDWVAAAFRKIVEAYPGTKMKKEEKVQLLYCAAWKHLMDGIVFDEARTILVEACRAAVDAVNRWVDHENLRR